MSNGQKAEKELFRRTDTTLNLSQKAEKVSQNYILIFVVGPQKQTKYPRIGLELVSGLVFFEPEPFPRAPREQLWRPTGSNIDQNPGRICNLSSLRSAQRKADATLNLCQMAEKGLLRRTDTTLNISQKAEKVSKHIFFVFGGRSQKQKVCTNGT